MNGADNPFLHITDPEGLTREERERYLDFWAARTTSERLGEVMRLNRAKWGDEVFDRGMDKSKIQVLDPETREVRFVIHNSKIK